MSFLRTSLTAFIFSSTGLLATQPQVPSTDAHIDAQIVEKITHIAPLHHPHLPVIEPIQLPAMPEPAESDDINDDTDWGCIEDDATPLIDDPSEQKSIIEPIIPIEETETAFSTRIKKKAIAFIVKHELFWIIDKLEAIKNNKQVSAILDKLETLKKQKQVSVLLDYFDDNPKVSAVLGSIVLFGGTAASLLTIKKFFSYLCSR